MCCVKFGARHDQRLWARAGVGLTLAAAALLLIGYWTESGSGVYWKLAIILAIFAGANAHVCALCFARLAPAHLWVLVTGAVVIYALAMIVAGMVSESWGHAPYKLIAVLAVLDLGITVAVPILHRLDQAQLPAAASVPQALAFTVTQNPDGSFSLPDGRVLVLKEPA